MKAKLFSLEVISVMQVWDAGKRNENKTLENTSQKELAGLLIQVSECEERELKMLRRFWTKEIWENNGKEKLKVASPMGICFLSSICEFKKVLSSAERSSRPDGEASWKRYWYIHIAAFEQCHFSMWGMLPHWAVVGLTLIIDAFFFFLVEHVFWRGHNS